MANVYWHADGGNWSDHATHWFNATDGGGGGHGAAPGTDDNAIFDANSFDNSSQTVTLDEEGNCLDMDWTGATNTPTFAGANALNVYGSLTLIAGMVRTWSGSLVFRSTSTGKTITLNGLVLGSAVNFISAGGGWTLQDAFNNGTANITHTNGTLDTNGQAITCASFISNNSNVRTLTLGASVVTCTRWWLSTTTNLTFTANTATIKVSGTLPFNGGGLTYNAVELNGSAHTITQSNTFATLTLKADTTQTITFTDGTTQTITTPVFTGSSGKVKTLQGSSTGGWTISDAAGTNDYSYLDITYSTAQGGATWQALLSNNNTDSGNNSGWVFSLAAKRGWLQK